jgi:VWFA-related protein
VYAIVLDDYHVVRMGELRVIEPLLAFVRQLPPTDLVAVYYPLDSVTDVSFSRDREPVLKAIHAFYGRRGDYTPKRPVEEEHLRHPLEIEQIRRQIVLSALEGWRRIWGSSRDARPSSSSARGSRSRPTSYVMYEAANRANVAIYPLDPRGLTMSNRGTTSAQMMNGLIGDRDAMRALALETGGRAIVQQNDIGAALGQVLRDASAYYLIAYESPHPDDGKFHRVTVRVKRTRATVFASTGYWALEASRSTMRCGTAAGGCRRRFRRRSTGWPIHCGRTPTSWREGRRRVLMPRPADVRPRR